MSKGLESLRAAVDRDIKNGDKFHDYEAKFNWIIERAKAYAEICGVTYEQVLDVWEENRTYWYMNYYQESSQPLPDRKTKVYVVDSVDDLVNKIKEHGNKGFRCSCCGGVTTKPYNCDSGLNPPKSKSICNWNTYGLFRGGVPIIYKKEMRSEYIFKPLYLEDLEHE